MRTSRILSFFVSVLTLTALTGSAHASPAAGNRQLWDRVFESGMATAEVLSPDGSTVYVTGCGGLLECSGKMQTVAYSVSSGRRLWSSKFTGAKQNASFAIAISPDGTRVFITGFARYTFDEFGEFQTIAYDAATGAELWEARYALLTRNFACCIGVSPDGTKVFVTGWSTGADFATVAYDAANGAQLWVARYSGLTGEGGGAPSALRVSPDGAGVYVTGASGGVDYNDYATIRYDAATGAQVWVARYNAPIKVGDTPYGMAVSPDGSRVFVTGCQGIIDLCANGDFLTIGYEAATGDQLWVDRYNGAGNDVDVAYDVGVSADGSLVFVTGTSAEVGGTEATTLAYDAGTGAEVWVQHFAGGGGQDGSACCLAVSPDGSRLIVSAESYVNVEYGQENYATIAYVPSTGSELWSASFSGTSFYNVPAAVAVTANGEVAVVTGTINGPDGQYDWGTVAYRS